MNIPSVAELNEQFSLQQDTYRLGFRDGEGGIPVVDLQNEQATASISLQGAHVLSWVPATEAEVIWVSEQASFAPGKSVRGGIPICWPWFGAHHATMSYPAHGFARTSLWPVAGVQVLPGGETQITFRLDTRLLDERRRCGHGQRWRNTV